MDLRATSLQELLLPGHGTLDSSIAGACRFALHPSRTMLAIAARRRLVYIDLRQSTTDQHTLQTSARPRNGSLLACRPNESAMALCWACFAASVSRSAPDLAAAAAGSSYLDSCLLVGTSTGFLQLHAADTGDLLHRQQLHNKAVIAISVRGGGMGLSPNDASGNVTITFADAVVRVLGVELRGLCRLRQRAPEHQSTPVNFTKWDTQKAAGPRTGALCAGSMAAGLYAALNGKRNPPKMALVTCGLNPPLAVFEVEEHHQRGVVAAVTELASSLKGWLPNPVRRNRSEPQLQAAEPATLFRSMWDDPTRTALSLLVAPRGSLAVTTDTLGRVVLWDLAAVTALRMWKGYRDAQCAWLMLPDVLSRRPAREIRMSRRSSSTAASSPMDHDGSESLSKQAVLTAAASSPDRTHTAGVSAMALSPATSPEPKARKRKVLEAVSLRASAAGGGRREALHLVIYAPKRGVVELWPLRQGRRLRSISCGGNCRLLAADPPLSAEAGLQQQCAWARDCLLLDFDTGVVTSVGPALLQMGQTSS